MQVGVGSIPTSGTKLNSSMPELPEVETIRRDLEKSILKQRIVEFELRTASQFKGKIKAEKFFPGKKFNKISRTGKLLIFEVSEPDNYLLCHLRMTGQLIHTSAHTQISSRRNGYSKTKQEESAYPKKHTHITIKFENGDSLFFNDIRKFGYMQLVNGRELQKIISKFGIEPLTDNFTLKKFQQLTKNRTLNIKSFLLNQALIAGIGNIYADEICFHSGIKPSTKLDKISGDKLEAIFSNCQKVIAKAIRERGTSFSDYRDGKGEKGNFLNYLEVYGRQGKNCLKCQSVIQKTKVGGRGTHYCPKCQK